MFMPSEAEKVGDGSNKPLHAVKKPALMRGKIAEKERYVHVSEA